MPEVKIKSESPESGSEIFAQRFQALAERWREKSEFLSSDSEIAMLPEYQSIIGMGPAAVPLILRALEQQTDHWFWALRAITDVDPTPAESRGQIEVMRSSWLEWGKQQGHLR